METRLSESQRSMVARVKEGGIDGYQLGAVYTAFEKDISIDVIEQYADGRFSSEQMGSIYKASHLGLSNTELMSFIASPAWTLCR